MDYDKDDKKAIFAAAAHAQRAADFLHHLQPSTKPTMEALPQPEKSPEPDPAKVDDGGQIFMSFE